MPRTLLTGANSFVGAHVINSLIAAGHDIVGTIRRESLIEEIYSLHPEWKEKLQLIVVKDLADENNWDEVFKKYSFDHVGTYLPYLFSKCIHACHGKRETNRDKIVHVAAPLVDNPETDYDRYFLKPNVEG